MRKVVIVGGVAGGASAAARLRRLDEDAHIVLVERGEHISFANCGLPYYVGDVIKERRKLLVQTPKAMKKRFNIDVRINSEVTKIDRVGKSVLIRDMHSGEVYQETYDQLVLSPGAFPIRPAISGIDLPEVFILRNIPDTYKIRDYVDRQKKSRALVVGGGFIGIEMMENLVERGVKVTLAELSTQILAPLDYEMAAMLHNVIREKGVELRLGEGLAAIEKDENGLLRCSLTSGSCVEVDMVILAIGVKPETGLAKEAGLSIGSSGGILVDPHLRTSDPDIYAVGDAIEVVDFVSQNKIWIPLAGPANKQGRIVGSNIAGGEEVYEGTQGTFIIKIFGHTAASTGNNEKQLKRYGLDYEKVYVHPSSHASYYPGASTLSLKLIFNPGDGKILGAQAVGPAGADKRIDVLSTAIRAGMTVGDLEKLELCYAPPFSSAKDPVNMAGYTANNWILGKHLQFHWHEVEALDREKVSLIDIRTPEEFAEGTISGAVNIPLDEIRDRLNEFPKDKNIYIFCRAGLRGYVGYRILAQKGYQNVWNLSGGYLTWCPVFTGSNGI